MRCRTGPPCPPPTSSTDKVAAKSLARQRYRMGLQTSSGLAIRCAERTFGYSLYAQPTLSPALASRATLSVSTRARDGVFGACGPNPCDAMTSKNGEWALPNRAARFEEARSAGGPRVGAKTRARTRVRVAGLQRSASRHRSLSQMLRSSARPAVVRQEAGRSKSRNRLSGTPASPVSFLGKMGPR